MKSKQITMSLAAIVCLAISSCSLNHDPISEYSEKTIAAGENDSIKYKTKLEMQTQYEALYNEITNSQEIWALDYWVYTEVHADNAYGGNSSELSSLQNQTQDGINKNIERDWDGFLKQINNANRIINHVDRVPDNDLSIQERKQWKAEAKIWRAWMLFEMVRLWGDVPIVTSETPNITANNIEEIYHLLYPARKPISEVYAQVIEDLTDAIQENAAPNNNAESKFKLSKSVAHALLAKVYAEKPLRNYQKTIEYCSLVEQQGFDLMPQYADLFSINEAKTDVNNRHTKEAIFEIPFPQGSGNWITWMLGIDQCNPNSLYDWEKWIIPSRDLIEAFIQEGDSTRKNESIIFAKPPWSTFYPANNYPFMYKMRSRYNSIIKLRLADIILLKAEALVETGNLHEAAILVNRIRNRAQLPNLDSNTTSSKDKMANAVLNERRLELAFEGQRWFDLIRNDKAIETINALPSKDPIRNNMAAINNDGLLLPIPQKQLDMNPSLLQNKGY
ncbi:membrane protein [Bacteroidales bacterium]|nr:membrane protein [Bacteroidales bacterium]